MAFRFRDFAVDDRRCAMRVGTDGVLLGSWVDVTDVRLAVDAGAGSGLLALMLAVTRGVEHVTAVEVDAASAADCRDNVATAGLNGRIDVVQADFANFEPSHPVDLLISNPPFHTEALHSPDSQRAGARHADGLSPEALIIKASRWLSANGSLAMIAPSGRNADLTFLAVKHRLYPRRVTDVVARQGRDPLRRLWQLSRHDGPYKQSVLTLRDAAGRVTDEYLNLTKDFYLTLK